MPVYIATLVLTFIYYWTSKRRKRADGAQEIFFTAAARVSGVALIVGVLFSGFQVFLAASAERGWAGESLLEIERNLSWTRWVLDSVLTSRALLISAGVALLLLILIPALAKHSRPLGQFANLIGLGSKLHLILVAMTSLTFFGTGIGAGAPALNASLVESRDRYERGLVEAKTAAVDAAEQIVQDSIEEFLDKHEVDEEIRTITESVDVFAQFPSIKPEMILGARAASIPHAENGPAMRALVDRLTDHRDGLLRHSPNALTEGMNRAYEAVASATSGSADRNDKLGYRLPGPDGNRSIEDFNQALNAIRRLREEAKPGRESRFSSAGAPKDVMKLSVGLALGRIEGTVLKSAGAGPGGSAAVDFLSMFIDESLREPVREVVQLVAGSILDSVLVNSMSPAKALETARRLAATKVREMLGAQFLSRARESLGALRNRAERLSDAMKNLEPMWRAASLELVQDRAVEIESRVSRLASDFSGNPFVSDQTDHLLRSLSERLRRATESGDLALIERIEKIVSSPVASLKTVERIEALQSVEAEIQVHESSFRAAVERAVDAAMRAEFEGRWGAIRSDMEMIVDNRLMNVAEFKKDNAQKALAEWRKERFRLGAEAAFGAGLAQSMTAEQFERSFARYLRDSPTMTALWGFAVIALLEDRSVFDRQVVDDARNRVAQLLRKYGHNEFVEGARMVAREHFGRTFNDLANRFPGASSEKDLARQILQEYYMEGGPKPAHGYIYYMRETGSQGVMDALNWVKSDKVGRAIDSMCPN